MTKEQIDHLNKYQKHGMFHPLTCRSGNRKDKAHTDGDGVLVATVRGWECPFCHYTQAYWRIEEEILKLDLSYTAEEMIQKAFGPIHEQPTNPTPTTRNRL